MSTPLVTRSKGAVPPWEVIPITPMERPMCPPFVFYDGWFTPEQCDDIVRIGLQRPLGNGTVGNSTNGEAKEDLEYRSVKLRSFSQRIDAVHWMLERLREAVVFANDEYYRFDITGLLEPAQFLMYSSGGATEVKQPGHYKMHQDFGGGTASWRKLSLVLNLTDPALYQGCRLKLVNEVEYEPGHYGRGDLMIFPSWTPHLVTPIESGTRYALVAWFGGPQFR